MILLKKILGNLRRTGTGNVIPVYDPKNTDHILKFDFGTFEWNCEFQDIFRQFEWAFAQETVSMWFCTSYI